MESGPMRPVAVPVTQSNFPRVTPVIQRERDSERRRILSEELLAERSALNDAVERQAPDVVIRRYRANVSALERELDNTR
jgi:hypothetical protein